MASGKGSQLRSIFVTRHTVTLRRYIGEITSPLVCRPLGSADPEQMAHDPPQVRAATCSR